MWFVPTYGRPERCQQLLDSIIAVGCSTPGIVVVDGDGAEAYRTLKLPEGWTVERLLDKRRGLLATLNYCFEKYRFEPWYGFLNDDFIVHTPGWDKTMVEAAGNRGFANSDDGWQKKKRMCGALTFGGDLLRALGWWSPPGLWHCYADNVWETLGRKLNNWTYVSKVLVEHRHHLNGKTEDDATYRLGRAKFAEDEKAYDAFCENDLGPAINRVLTLFKAETEKNAKRMDYMRTRKVMMAIPIAREVTPQHYLSMIETVGELERGGFSYAIQCVIGSSNLPRARNELVARFLASKCTDLLFIDDDIRFSPLSVFKLLSSEQPFIAGVGRKRSDVPLTDLGSWCCHFLPCTNNQVDLITDGQGAVEVMRVGTGFLKLSREVFETLIKANPDWKRPGRPDMPQAVRDNYYRFFHFAEDNDEMGEDYMFCDHWRAEGGRIWIDPFIDLGHIGAKEFGGAIAELMSSRPKDREQLAA